MIRTILRSMYKTAAGKWESLLMGGKLSPSSIDVLRRSGLYKTPEEYGKKVISGVLRDYHDLNRRMGLKSRVFFVDRGLGKKTRIAINDYLDNMLSHPKSEKLILDEAKLYFPELIKEKGERGAIDTLKRAYKKIIIDRFKGGSTLNSFSFAGGGGSLIGIPSKSDPASALVALHEAMENKGELKSIARPGGSGSFDPSHVSPEVIDIERKFMDRIHKLYPQYSAKTYAELPGKSGLSFLKGVRKDEEYAVLDRLKQKKIPLSAPGVHYYTDEAGNLVLSSHPSKIREKRSIETAREAIKGLSQKPTAAQSVIKPDKYLNYQKKILGKGGESFRSIIRWHLDDARKRFSLRKPLPLPG